MSESAEEPLHQSHDKLFKLTFGQPENAAAAFRTYLPEHRQQHLHLTRMTLVPSTFIDERYHKLESDLLYQVPARNSAVFVYILFEHQSQEDASMALRLLIYMCRIWEEWRSRHPPATALPVILPLVLSQQSAKWRSSPTFSAMFKLTPEQQADFAGVLPDFTFQLLELGQLSFEQILGTPMGVMTLRMLKAQALDALASNFIWDEPLLLQLAARDLEATLRSIYGNGHLDIETFVSKLKLLRTANLRTDAMTLAEQFEQRGMKKGVVKGRTEGALIGQIQLSQELLGRSIVPSSVLEELPFSKLQEIYDELRRSLPGKS